MWAAKSSRRSWSIYLLQEFEEIPEKIWESNIFGKCPARAGQRGAAQQAVPDAGDARIKLQETIERIINEGCSGLICIIL